MVDGPHQLGLGAAVLAIACGGLSLQACGGSKASTSTTGTTSLSGTGPATNTSTGEATPSHVVSKHVVTVTSGTVTASMNAAGHHPRVNAPWPIRFSVSNEDKPARAEVRYEYLFGGQVVAHRSRYSFTGSFHDTFRWPASAVGYPLIFRAVIHSAEVTLNLDYPVQVVR